MPYNVNAKNLPTGPSTLPATLNSGCQYNAAKASNATQIVCIFKDFQLLDKTTPANAVTAYSTVSKKKVVSTTPALPVNIFVKGV